MLFQGNRSAVEATMTDGVWSGFIQGSRMVWWRPLLEKREKWRTRGRQAMDRLILKVTRKVLPHPRELLDAGEEIIALRLVILFVLVREDL